MDKSKDVIKVQLPGPHSFFEALEASNLTHYFFSVDSDINDRNNIDSYYYKLQNITLPFFYQTSSKIELDHQKHFSSDCSYEEKVVSLHSELITQLSDSVDLSSFTGAPGRVSVKKANLLNP